MIIYNDDNNHDLMVVLVCFVVIPDSLDGSIHTVLQVMRILCHV